MITLVAIVAIATGLAVVSDAIQDISYRRRVDIAAMRVVRGNHR